MQKNDDNQQQQSLTSEYSTGTLLFNATPASSSDGPNYDDIAKILSQVELPSPSPTPATSCGFQDGQSSGTKMVDDHEIEEKVEGKELKDTTDLQGSGMRFQANDVTRSTRQRRRNLIQERIRALKELIPSCNKRDQASILDDAITHIKSLQMQVQMMQFMGAGTMPQGLYMSPGRHPSLQGVPYLSPYFMMRPMDGMGYNMGHYGSYFNSVPSFPPFGQSSFHPLVPPTQLPIVPHLQCPSQTISQHVYSTTLSSDTTIATASQVGSAISSQSYHYMPPVTSHEGQ